MKLINLFLLPVLLVIGLGILTPSYAQNDFTFALTPTDGKISGAPGATIGWGYNIVNNSQYWLFPIDIQVDGSFQHGTATTDLFDYPSIPPGSFATTYYSTGTGLVDFTWDKDAPVGFVNSGTFALSAYYYDGDPFSGGQYVADAGTQTALYQASVLAPAAVPEASSMIGFGIGFALLVATTLASRFRGYRQA